MPMARVITVVSSRVRAYLHSIAEPAPQAHEMDESVHILRQTYAHTFFVMYHTVQCH